MGDIGGTKYNNLNYDRFPYRYFGYSRASRNPLEHNSNTGASDGHRQTAPTEAVIGHATNRVLGPKRLCYLRESDSVELCGFDTQDVDDTKQQSNYIFVAYANKQFSKHGKDDFKDLHSMAEREARFVRADAFWVASKCLDVKEPHELYRISDIVRASSSIVVVVGKCASDPAHTTYEQMIQQWGDRVWTFPELLLSAAGKPIRIYVRGPEKRVVTYSKLNFAKHVFRDTEKVRMLIDHYEGTAVLGRLQLTMLAYECIQTRAAGEKYLPGDHAYALMGLLSLRAVDPSDSGFQAFARLALLNDSDRLLERIICMLPSNGNYDSSAIDEYGARAWDIEPFIQVSGIGQDDTVIVDGAFSASIRWGGFRTVYSERRESVKRLIARGLVHTSGIFFYVGIFLLALRQTVPGALLFVYGLIIVSMSPWLLRIMCGGKFWKTQASFFGFEGYMPLEEIEQQIFGARMHRLRWAPCGSQISRHEANGRHECIGIDPSKYEEVEQMISSAKTAEYGQRRIFTLIDTATMTVMLIYAARPPIGLLLVGSEGGMLRAIAVSYDWESQTLVKQTVLRLETPTADRMERIPRVKSSLGRDVPETRSRGDEPLTRNRFGMASGQSFSMASFNNGISGQVPVPFV